MAISTDRFRVNSIRPAAYIADKGVPDDLRDMVLDMVVTAGDLQDGRLQQPGLDVKAYRLHHGGDGIVEVYWHGEEYILDLEPVPEQVS